MVQISWSTRKAYLLVTALSLSVGWGIRGNFGHEYGALLPGGTGRDGRGTAVGPKRLAGCGSFLRHVGALGWSFGGSMSYMQVIGYTHSGQSPSVLYGFANLFVIGFLWAALGGMGTALPAVAGRRRLAELLPILALVLVFWWLQGVVIEPGLLAHGYELDWYDTDWMAALLALAAAFLMIILRHRVDRGTSLVLHLALGWWLGFGLLVLGLGLRMTPPRGDNWAGCLGMTAGAIVYCVRTGLAEAARAGLVSGFIGGIGFAAASMLKLVEVTSGYQTNWHSILEADNGAIQRYWHCRRHGGARQPRRSGRRRAGAREAIRSLGQAAGRGLRRSGHTLHQFEEERGRLDPRPFCARDHVRHSCLALV